MTIPMLIFGVLSVISACGVVVGQKPLTSALCLVATLCFVAVHFALLGADFLAALQILIYAGAISILVVFVIMLLGLNMGGDTGEMRFTKYLAGIACGGFLGMLCFAVLDENSLLQTGAQVVPDGSPKELGRVLMTNYAFPFQIAALLLLAAIIGAVVLAYEKKRPLGEGRGLSAMQNKNS